MKMLFWVSYAFLISYTYAYEATFEISFVYDPREELPDSGDTLENDYVTNETAYGPRNPPGSDHSNHSGRSIRAAEFTTTSAAACLEKKEEFRRKSKNRPLQMVLVVEEDEEARMACHFCEDTDSTTENRFWDVQETASGKPIWQTRAGVASPILWYTIAHKDQGSSYMLKEIKPVMHDDDLLNRVYISTAHTLVIEKATPSDSGTYFCHDTRVSDRYIKPVVKQEDIQQLLAQEGVFRFLVHLSVLKHADIPLKEVSTSEWSKKDRPTAPIKYSDLNLKMFWEWSKWSPCSMCDQMGEKRMRGVCTVKKLDKQNSVKPWYLDAILNSYPSGVPCRSSLFRNYKNLNFALWRPDEVQTETCEEPCKPGILASLLKGYRSLSFQSLKSMIFNENKATSGAAAVKLSVVNVTAGSTVDMECPRAKVDQPVMWVNKTKYTPSTQMQNRTKGRAWVIANGTLYISRVSKADEGRWMCLVAGEKTGHVQLNVLVSVSASNDFYRYGWWVVMAFPVYFILFVFLMHIKHIHRKHYVVADDDDEDDDDEEEGASSVDQSDETAPDVEGLSYTDETSINTGSEAGNTDITEDKHDNADNANDGVDNADNAESELNDVDNTGDASDNAHNTVYGYNTRDSNFHNPRLVSGIAFGSDDCSENSANTVVSADSGDQDSTTTTTLESSYYVTDDSYSNPTTSTTEYGDHANTIAVTILDGSRYISDGSCSTPTETTPREGRYFISDASYPNTMATPRDSRYCISDGSYSSTTETIPRDGRCYTSDGSCSNTTSATAKDGGPPTPSTARQYSGQPKSTASSTSYGGYLSTTATPTSYESHNPDGSHPGTRTSTPRAGSYYIRH